MRKASFRVAWAVLGLLLSQPVWSQPFPHKPLKLIIPYVAGGPTDLVGRMLAQRLGDRLGQPVVVENKVGANGMIGTQAVATAAPDGYTLLLAIADTHSIAPQLYSKIAYDARKDFAPIGLLGFFPGAVVVNPTLPVEDMRGLIRLAKEKPRSLTYASWGMGSSGHLRTEMIAQYAGIEIVHVPFSGAPPALAALIGGHVDFMLLPLSAAEQNHRAGKLRMIGVSTPQRNPAVPDAPTFAEQGLPIDISAWIGIMVPAKVPADIAARLNQEMNAVVADPEARRAFAQSGLQIADPRSPREFAQFLDAEYRRWGDVIRNARVTVE